MRTLKSLPSALGIRVLTALGQAPGGLRLSAIADAVEAPLTSVDAAVRRLVAAGLVERAADRRYLLGEATEVDLLLRLGYGTREGAAAGLRANRLVLYAGRDETGWLLAIRGRHGDPAFARLLALRGSLGEPQELIEVDALSSSAASVYRARADRAETIVGSAARAFPRLAREGQGAGHLLHGLNRALQAPSARRLRVIAHEYGLRRVVAFGSAVRSDFDEESDVDLLVEMRPGRRLGITDLTSLQDRFEDLFERRVDVITEAGLLPGVASAAEREGVILVG
ncbi:MAG: nucleotidyltransferase family protein [Dermatophilaceae bacterium]